MTTKLEIGQKIETTDDAGIVDAIDGDQVTVRWDSGIATTQRAQGLIDAIQALRGATGGRDDDDEI